MKKLSKKDSTILLVIVTVAVLWGLKYYVESHRLGPYKGLLSRAKGDPKASIQIIEYIDLQCPACAKGATYLKSCFEKYPDRFYLEMKFYPLGMHRHAFQSARYTYCASKQGKFWPFHDLVIERQKNWEDLFNADPAFRQIAQEISLDLTKLDACLQDEHTNQTILDEKEKGTRAGVKSTPTYFINGKMVVGYKELALELGKLSNAGEGHELVCSE